MECGEVTLVDAVATVDIGADGVARGDILVLESQRLEGGMLMGRSVGSEKLRGVDVVGVSPGATGVVWREAEDVKVLFNSHNGVCLDEMIELGRGEAGFNQFASDTERMIGVVVQIATNMIEDGLGNIGGVVEQIRLA